MYAPCRSARIISFGWLGGPAPKIERAQAVQLVGGLGVGGTKRTSTTTRGDGRLGEAARGFPRSTLPAAAIRFATSASTWSRVADHASLAGWPCPRPRPWRGCAPGRGAWRPRPRWPRCERFCWRFRPGGCRGGGGRPRDLRAVSLPRYLPRRRPFSIISRADWVRSMLGTSKACAIIRSSTDSPGRAFGRGGALTPALSRYAPGGRSELWVWPSCWSSPHRGSGGRP
jgi:hypothetical protein